MIEDHNNRRNSLNGKGVQTTRYRKSGEKFSSNFTKLLRKLWTSGKLLLLTALAVVPVRQATAVVYQLEGTLERIVHNPMTGAITDSKGCKFVVSVSNDCWMVQTRFGENDWIEFGSDGTDVYSVLYDPAQRPDGFHGIVRPASVTPGTYPSQADPWTATLWLALASGSYTAKHKNRQLPVPWTMPLMDPTAMIFENNSQFAESPHLPLAITFKVSKSLLSSAATNHPFGGYFDGQSIEWLKGYPVGFIGGKFEVNATTNVGPLKFPSNFILARNDTAHGKVVETYLGKVSNVSVGATAVRLPELPQPAGVSDFRFRDEQNEGGVTYINYVVTNQTWLPYSDSGLRSIFDKRKQTWGRVPSQRAQSTSPVWIRIVMLLVVATPVIFWVSHKLISRKTSRT